MRPGLGRGRTRLPRGTRPLTVSISHAARCRFRTHVPTVVFGTPTSRPASAHEQPPSTSSSARSRCASEYRRRLRSRPPRRTQPRPHGGHATYERASIPSISPLRARSAAASARTWNASTNGAGVPSQATPPPGSSRGSPRPAADGGQPRAIPGEARRPALADGARSRPRPQHVVQRGRRGKVAASTVASEMREEPGIVERQPPHPRGIVARFLHRS